MGKSIVLCPNLTKKERDKCMRRKTSIAAGRGGVPRPMSPSHQRGKIENSSGDPSLLCHQEARPRSSTPPTVPHQGLPTRPPPPLPQVTQVEAGLVAARMGPDEWAGAASGSWGEGGETVRVSVPKLSLQRPLLTLRGLRWEVGVPHLQGRAQHQESEEGVGRGHWAGLSTCRGHSHRHHGVWRG